MLSTERAAFEKRLSGAATPDVAYWALEQLAAASVGVRLFTVMILEDDAMLARRVYSNHPSEYPVTGTKPIEPNAWFKHVIESRRVFAANTLEQIAEVFPDNELIAALGCGAVINLPVVRQDRVAATINLLDAEGAYPPDVVAIASEVLMQPAERVLAHTRRSRG